MRGMMLVAGLAAAMVAGGQAIRTASGRSGEVWQCRNAASGVRWSLRLDPAAASVNGHRARFRAGHVRWTQANGAHADLERGRGVLTMTRGSSTGGWVQVVRCHPRR